MQKTPLKPRYLSALAALNDQLCYSLFARNQLRATFENFNISDAGHLFLKSVFAKNHYAPKINIRIDQVQTFESEHERTSFGALYPIATRQQLAGTFSLRWISSKVPTLRASYGKKKRRLKIHIGTRYLPPVAPLQCPSCV